VNGFFSLMKRFLKVPTRGLAQTLTFGPRSTGASRPVMVNPRDLPRAEDDAGRDESEAERIDRNLTELLQELRVAGLGVQVLFGFLLALPFAARFDRLDGAERNLYIADVLAATLATALLTGPVAFHRLAFRRHEKARVLQASHLMAIAGLAMVGLAVSGAVVLIMSVVAPGTATVVVGAATLVAFAGLWFVFPLTRRGRDDY
jgi:O-antigen/teichoic acid export membrane protein